MGWECSGDILKDDSEGEYNYLRLQQTGIDKEVRQEYFETEDFRTV